MSNYLAKTVMKQYANSATLLALLADFDQWVDASQFSAEFLANVWDISTAQGFGLDIWGRILGQSRYIQVAQVPGHNFGFNINPVGGTVNAINQEFGVGDGSTVGFQLLGPDHRPATTSVVVNQMTRQDWQGVQQIYSTPRTNLITFSQAIDNAAWGKNNAPTITPNVINAPDGTATADLLSMSGNANCGVYKNNVLTGLSIGATVYILSLVKYASGVPQQQIRFEGTAFPSSPAVVVHTQSGAILSQSAGIASCTVTPLANGWFLVLQSAAATAAGAMNATWYAGTSAAVGTYFGGCMVSTTPGAYIPTTTTAVTVTDWSINGTGFVTLAAAPQGPTGPGGAAVLRWSGTYTGTVVGTQWQPWSQAPWFGGAAAGTTAFPLDDSFYRQLLLVKAAANIASSDCPSINALMRSMFGTRGRCYVGYDPAKPMHIGYHFEFFPTPVEKSIIESGLFPQPAGTIAEYIYETLTYSPFGFAGANTGANPKVVTGWSQNPFYQPH